MLKNYFKIALRNLAGNKAYSFINIAGLSIAAAAILVILIAVFTVSFQAIKAAVANPVRSLRTE